MSAVFIVPLFFLPHASELIKVGLQLLWGVCLSRAAFMANDTWKKKLTLKITSKGRRINGNTGFT